MGVEWLNLTDLPEGMLPEGDEVAVQRGKLAERANDGARYAFCTGKLEAEIALIARAHAQNHADVDEILARTRRGVGARLRPQSCGTCKALRRALALVLAIEGMPR